MSIGSSGRAVGSSVPQLRRNSLSLVVRPSIELVKRRRKRYVAFIAVLICTGLGLSATFQDTTRALLQTLNTFNHDDYLRLYPELRDHLHTAAQSRQHYQRIGKQEGRLGLLPRILLQYTACATLPEQLYSHVAALAVAKALHAELVVPIAYTLDSSGNYTAYDARSILDVSRMRALWARAGVTLHAAPASGLTYFPPVNTAADRTRAYPRYVFEGVHHQAVVNVPHVFGTLQTLEQLVDSVAAAIGARTRPLLQTSSRTLLGPTVVVNLPCMFCSIHNPSAPNAIAFAATGLAFPPALEAMAATMLRTLRAGGSRFYGMVAGDQTDVEALLGRNQTRLGLLLAAARAYFGAPHLCYLGMEWLHDVRGRSYLDMQDRLVAESPCTSLITKYQLLDSALLQGLHSEQHKLIDMLVLLEAAHTVGTATSLMTLLLHELTFLRKGAERYSVVRVALTEAQRQEDPLAWGVFTQPGMHVAPVVPPTQLAVDDRPPLVHAHIFTTHS